MVVLNESAVLFAVLYKNVPDGVDSDGCVRTALYLAGIRDTSLGESTSDNEPTPTAAEHDTPATSGLLSCGVWMLVAILHATTPAARKCRHVVQALALSVWKLARSLPTIGWVLSSLIVWLLTWAARYAAALYMLSKFLIQSAWALVRDPATPGRLLAALRRFVSVMQRVARSVGGLAFVLVRSLARFLCDLTRDLAILIAHWFASVVRAAARAIGNLTRGVALRVWRVVRVAPGVAARVSRWCVMQLAGAMRAALFLLPLAAAAGVVMPLFMSCALWYVRQAGRRTTAPSNASVDVHDAPSGAGNNFSHGTVAGRKRLVLALFRRIFSSGFEHLWENHAIDRLMTSVFERNALVQASDKEQTMQALCLAALFRADASVNEPQVVILMRGRERAEQCLECLKDLARVVNPAVQANFAPGLQRVPRDHLSEEQVIIATPDFCSMSSRKRLTFGDTSVLVVVDVSDAKKEAVGGLRDCWESIRQDLPEGYQSMTFCSEPPSDSVMRLSLQLAGLADVQEVTLSDDQPPSSPVPSFPARLGFWLLVACASTAYCFAGCSLACLLASWSIVLCLESFLLANGALVCFGNCALWLVTPSQETMAAAMFVGSWLLWLAFVALALFVVAAHVQLFLPEPFAFASTDDEEESALDSYSYTFEEVHVASMADEEGGETVDSQGHQRNAHVVPMDVDEEAECVAPHVHEYYRPYTPCACGSGGTWYCGRCGRALSPTDRSIGCGNTAWTQCAAAAARPGIASPALYYNW